MNYQIIGEPLPAVICNVDANETLITERGSMSWMTPNMKMETTTNGGIGKAFGRMFSGESIFQNRYTAIGGPGQITFASSFPGSIRALELRRVVRLLFKKAVFWQVKQALSCRFISKKRLGAGFFGGEGFIMQRLSGHGIAFVEIDGFACKYNLAPGQQMVIDTGYLAAMESSCSIDIVRVPGVKNVLFGGEGLFNTVVTGPGKIWLQSMPISAVAGALGSFIPSSGN
mgnify:CR=1 FL=1